MPSTMSYFPHALLSVYAGCICFLDVILFLIAAFYRRKFNEASPGLGFIVGGLLGAGLAVAVFVPYASLEIARIIQGALLVGAALASGSATLILYFIMGRSKK